MHKQSHNLHHHSFSMWQDDVTITSHPQWWLRRANSFATTVGARALTLGQVVILAGICEFLGAVLLGAGVTSTIKSGVADIKVFQDKPTLLMYGEAAQKDLLDGFAAQL